MHFQLSAGLQSIKKKTSVLYLRVFNENFFEDMQNSLSSVGACFGAKLISSHLRFQSALCPPLHMRVTQSAYCTNACFLCVYMYVRSIYIAILRYCLFHRGTIRKYNNRKYLIMNTHLKNITNLFGSRGYLPM